MRRLMVLAAGLLSLVGVARSDYRPVAEPVVDNVYAIVGPLGQRSTENDGLNANFGFVVTGEGVILIDSGASRLGAEKLAAAIRAVTDKPVRWVINTGSQDHRWLGNDYFAGEGAEVIAMARTAATQAMGMSITASAPIHSFPLRMVTAIGSNQMATKVNPAARFVQNPVTSSGGGSLGAMMMSAQNITTAASVTASADSRPSLLQ